ncbi:hypothetical protein FA13DRAFT_860141 [Coprinellus micaceus]|uniref:Fungal-type protein kinase domain-containing protein n=1 Tax=Coprinellus micaceus TaxID=71717 RepID=A0A4Y7S103_COPMI|nr:hypothetical protein FA13DRAFT_860141 [Coprinellus micaceus]
MSFLFAREAELGCDPKVKRLLDNRLVFGMEDEQHNPTFYRTVRTLSEYGSCNITGRMTRVWEVNHVSGPEADADILRSGLVLKGVWLDESSPTERLIQSEIFAAIECRKAFIDTNQCVQRLEPDALKELKHLVEEERYKTYFLTILADLEGQVSKSVPPVARRKRGLLCPEIKHVGTPGSHRNIERVSSSTPQANQPEEERAAQRPAVPRVFRPKRQYRSVCAELCDTVGKMRSPDEVLKVPNQTLSGECSVPA